MHYTTGKITSIHIITIIYIKRELSVEQFK